MDPPPSPYGSMPQHSMVPFVRIPHVWRSPPDTAAHASAPPPGTLHGPYTLFPQHCIWPPVRMPHVKLPAREAATAVQVSAGVPGTLMAPQGVQPVGEHPVSSLPQQDSVPLVIRPQAAQ